MPGRPFVQQAFTEGEPAIPLTPSERRGMRRLRVQFRTTFSGSTQTEGNGTVRDVSLGGCCIETTTPVRHSGSMELRIHAPDLYWPIMIDGATVQWVNGQTFGVAFSKIRERDRERLRQVIARLADEEED